MNPAFEKHAAYMAQAWRTLQDSVLLKNQRSPIVGYHSSEESRRPPPPNIARIVADNPGAADDRHCQSQDCFAFRTRDSPYCAPCKQGLEDENESENSDFWVDSDWNVECDTPDCTNLATPTTVKWSAEGHRYCRDCILNRSST